MRRLAVFVVVAAALVLVPAAPASAHTVSGAGATNFRSAVAGVSPAVAGLSVRVVENGRRVQVTNRGPEDVVILGYFAEPYLRVGPAGVFENRRSPSVALNAPAAAGPPDWRRLSGGRTVRWHDHRTHWTGSVPASLVRHAPASGLVVREWHIDLLAGGQPVQVTGTLAYVPGPAAWPWVGLALGLALATGAVARTRHWPAGLAAALSVLVATDIVHAAGIGFEYAGSTVHDLALILAGSYYSVVAWAVGGAAVYLLSRRNLDGLFAAMFAGVIIGVWSGGADVSVLYRSQPPFAWAPVIERATVAAALGLGAGVVAGVALVLRRNREPLRAAR